MQFNAGIKVFGQYSRALDQKSFSINLRDKYGPTEVCYPFFKNNDINVFSAFVLRSSGQDNTSAHIRDAFCAMAVKGQMEDVYKRQGQYRVLCPSHPGRGQCRDHSP